MTKTYRLTCNFWIEGKRCVGNCPELGVSSFGRNLEEARKRLREALTLYLENARILGLMDDRRETS